MLINLQREALRKAKPSEYALRVFMGGCVTVATGLIAMKWGPVVGGLFLAFPAIFPASATLVEKHEGKSRDPGLAHETTRGRRAAGLDAVGSSIGGIGLLAFALVVWRLLPLFHTVLVLIAATLAWLVVSVLFWYLRRRISTIWAAHVSKRRGRHPEYLRSSNPENALPQDRKGPVREIYRVSTLWRIPRNRGHNTGAVPKRILVVDDNPAIRGALRRILEFNDGWTVCGEAVDGRDGVEKANELRPDLIVLDLSMPVMNGLEAARHLHQTQPQLPLILCSLHSDDVLQREAAEAGVTAIVSKAHNMETLVRKARELLASR